MEEQESFQREQPNSAKQYDCNRRDLTTGSAAEKVHNIKLAFLTRSSALLRMSASSEVIMQVMTKIILAADRVHSWNEALGLSRGRGERVNFFFVGTKGGTKGEITGEGQRVLMVTR